MAFIIVYGLITWNNITGPASADAIQIELYSKQFDWTARYPGENKVFGAADYNLIGTTNALGLVTKEGVAQKIAEIDHNIEATEKAIAEGKAKGTMPDSYMESLEDQLYKLKRHKQRILDLKENELNGQSQWMSGADDKIVKGEFHIPVGQEVEFVFRSQDVIHSAYMPHFRSQMNTVPGVPTRFKMKPTITTAEMRQKLGNDKFDYLLLCNKVCGAAHFNMKMTIVVDTPEDYAAWLAEQKTFGGESSKKEEAAPSSDTTMVSMLDK
jgi:cytochrome c oxidase subunit 2